jgi:hypothetical protein
MTRQQPKKRKHDGEIADPPSDGNDVRCDNGDPSHADDAEQPRQPVALPHDRQLLRDRRRLEVLLRRSPSHVVARNVRSKGRHDVERQAGEEDDAHGDVADAFFEGGAEGGGLGAVAGGDDGDCTAGGEDGDDGEEDAERGKEGERHLGSPVEEEDGRGRARGRGRRRRNERKEKVSRGFFLVEANGEETHQKPWRRYMATVRGEAQAIAQYEAT